MKLERKTREKAIEMLNTGLTSREIASQLGLSIMQVAGLKAHLTIRDRSSVQLDVEGAYPSQEAKGELAKVLPSSVWSRTNEPKEPDAQSRKTSVLIGTDLFFQKKVYWNFHPKTGSMNPHMLIVGETGSGKTYATQCIVGELTKLGISTVIFDYGQGFGIEESTKEFLELAKPIQIEASKNGIAINPLEIFPDDAMGPVNVAQRIADSFCRIYPRIGIQQREAIVEAVQRVLAQSGIVPEDRTTWARALPAFGDVHRMLRTLAEMDDEPLKGPANTASSHIGSFFRFNIIRGTGEELHWSEMVDSHPGCWIIQLRGLDHFVSMIVTEMLLWNLVSYLQSKGPSEIRAFVILDEAHKLSFDRNTPIDWIMREGRKFGVGGILASQQLDDYSSVALSNTSTKLVFQNNDDRNTLSKFLSKKCSNISDYRTISSIITQLERGNALLLTQNTGRLIKVDDIKERRVRNEN